jgi:translation initiation factor IF-3
VTLNNQNNNSQNQNSEKLFRINEQITAKQIRLIDQNGKMIGVMSVIQGIKQAQEANLDLVEISPNVEPPVCKIANFGKMRYEIQKKAADSRKKQKIIETKEVKMSFNIGKGDYEVKLRQVEKFVDKGDKVKVSIRMKGREISHIDIAKLMMQKLLEDVARFAKPESLPKQEGFQMVTILVKNK